jgi:hypothetical protein
LGASALRNEPGLANGIRISWNYRSSDGSASRLRSIYVFAGEACSMWVIFCPELSENRLFASLHSKRCALKAVGNLSLWAVDAYNSGWQALQSRDLALAEKKLDIAPAYFMDFAANLET